MHKRIVKAIELAISQHDKELFEIFVQSTNTDGFWKMCIIPKEDFKHLISHIESIGINIGRFYGEGLSVEKTKKYIIFS